MMDEIARVDAIVKRILAERGTSADAGACWVTLADGTERCYRGLDREGCALLLERSGLPTRFIADRFCP